MKFDKLDRKGGTRKIADFPQEKTCRDREHDPATMIVREPGYYEHTCPSCGHVTHFTVPLKPTLSEGYVDKNKDVSLSYEEQIICDISVAEAEEACKKPGFYKKKPELGTHLEASILIG